MARAAMFSKFHFSRIFRRVTGVSPGRFLSAIRLQEAKHLLVSTTLNVADISLRVGYNSVGTFSSRFTRSVGMSPTAYRRYRGFSSRIPVDETRGSSAGRTSTVQGHASAARSGTALEVILEAGPVPRLPTGTRSTVLLRNPGPARKT